MPGEQPKFDNRSAEVKWLNGWFRGIVSSPFTVRSDLMRQLSLWASAPGDLAPEVEGAMSGARFRDWATGEMDKRIAESRRRDAGQPYAASLTFEDPQWQAAWKDLMEKQWVLKAELEPNDRSYLSLYQFARPDEGSRSVIVEQSGDLKFCLDLVESGSAQLIKGRVRTGKSHWSALTFQWLDTAFDELEKLTRDGRGKEARLSRLSQVRFHARHIDADEQRELRKQYEDESSIGTKELGRSRYRGWKKILGLLTAKGLRLLTTKEIMPDSPRIDHILQAHDSKTFCRDMVLDNKQDLYTYADFDEAQVADRMAQGSMKVQGFMEFNRLRGHFDAALGLCTQDEKGQLPDEFLRSITATVEKPSKGRVIITNSLFNAEVFRDVPDTEIRYVHDSKVGFNWNMKISAIAGFVDQLRLKWEATHDKRQDPWTQGMNLDAWLQNMQLFTVSEADQSKGVNPLLAGSIRQYLMMRDATGRPYSDKRIRQLVNADIRSEGDNYEIEESRVAEERKKLDNEQRIDARRRGAGLPVFKDPEDFVDRELDSFAS